MVRLDFLIVTYNSASHVINCLQSVDSSTFSFSTQVSITVVDNCSLDNTVEAITTHFPNVKLIRNQRNIGFGQAINQAARAAKQRNADYYLVLNPDVVLGNDTLDCMIRFMETTPQCGLASCRMVDPIGRPAISYYEFHTIAMELIRLSRLVHLIPRSWWALAGRILPWGQGRTYLANCSASDKTLEVPVVAGACLLIRRAALGGQDIFDEQFFLYYEDMDLCKRMSLSGWDVFALLDCSAQHIGGASSGGRMATFCQKNEYRSMFLYHAKHYRTYGVAVLSIGCLLFSLLGLIMAPLNGSANRSLLQRQKRVLVFTIRVSWKVAKWCMSGGQVLTLPLVTPEV